MAVAGLWALTMPLPTAAQDRGQACTDAKISLPNELAGWSVRRPLQAAKQAGGLGAASLRIGQAVDATLLATPDVRYVVRPEKVGGSASHGGLFTFTVEQAGTYRVALGSGAWVDIVGQGRTLMSSAHGHGPECSGIHKIVDFRLTPGSYTLQIAASDEAGLALLVARLP